MSKRETVFRRLYNLPYGYTNSFQLFDSTKNSKSFIQRLRLQVKIPAHNGCVNSICWSESGKYLLSGSDDRHICVTQANTHSVLACVPTGHRANIFSAKFLPGGNDNRVISCSGDGIIIYSDLDYPETSLYNKFNCHFGTAYEITTVPNDTNTFLSCGEDGTVRWFDLRTKTSCSKENCKEDVLLNCRSGVSSLAVNPVAPYQLAVGCSDAYVRIFDRRMIGTSATGSNAGKVFQAMMADFTVPDFTSSHRITSLCYNYNGSEILVSYSSDFVYLFDVRCSFDRDAKVLGTSNTDQSTKARGRSFPSRPLMKRLRVRGDWSDTGPNARPESETRGEQQPRSLHASLMQRMSDVLTSMYNHRTRQSTSHSSSSSHSEESEMDDDANEAGGEEANGPEASNQSADSTSRNETDHPEETSVNQNESVHSGTTEEIDSSAEHVSLPSSTTSAASSTCVDLPFTTIKVPSCSSISESNISVVESQNNQPEEICPEALNLSLQNLRHELSSQRAVNEVSVKQPVIQNESAGQSSADNLCTVDGANSNEITANPCSSNSSEGHSVLPNNSEPMMILCDSETASNSASNTATKSDLSCDAASEPVQSHDSDIQSIRVSSTCSLGATSGVPDIYVASVPTSEEPSSASERPNSSQGEMSLMMDLESWDIVGEEDPNSSLNMFQSRPILEVPDSVMSVLKEEEEEDDEAKDEETDNESTYVNQLHAHMQNKYMGHRNARTMIKEATFWGDNFIMSGSDCGHIFIWDRHSTELVMLMEADHHVVNCLQPHPFDPILASSGIDYDIKIWAPLREEPFFDEEKASEIIKRNRVMLEETKDTITVPATFMIRMLASLNHITSGSGWRRIARQIREEHRNRRSNR